MGDEIAQTDAVSRVHDDGEMGSRFQDGNGVEIERVTGGGFERADPAFAEQDVHVSFAQDVFGAHDQIGDRGAEPALEQDRQMTPAHFFQKGKILHVACPDLEAVGIFLDQGQVPGVHDLGDNRQPGFSAGRGQETQAVFA